MEVLPGHPLVGGSTGRDTVTLTIKFAAAISFAASLAGADAAVAADAAHIDGAALAAQWAIPFVGLLLSIAVLPLAAPSLWHHHYGKITAAWAL